MKRAHPTFVLALLFFFVAIEAATSEPGGMPTPKVGGAVITVNPQPKFELSPYLYMQFMEPLGATDGSIEAAWDHQTEDWRSDLVDVTKEIAPPMMRWGGCISSYYRWKEAVGPRDQRVPMQNLLWGGIESNQIGTREFVDFCKRVGAESLICVNFESDGRNNWAHPRKGGERLAGPEEAAEWVDYCNNPNNALRKQHGVTNSCGVRFWQIGNETNYGYGHQGYGFDCETAAQKTLLFAKAMRKADPTIQLIGWGDYGPGKSGWAKRMLEVAGGELQYLAFHHMFDAGPPLRKNDFRKDPARTWDALMNACRIHEQKILKMRKEIAGSSVPLALTECHMALPGRNRCEVLSSWAAGVANARLANLHERHGDVLKIATLADYCGTRWLVNAVIIPTPAGKSFQMPVARIMSLYRKHSGKQAVEVVETAPGLDVTASRTGSHIFLHVVNTDRTQPVSVELSIAGMSIKRGSVFEIAAEPEFEVLEYEDKLAAKQKELSKDCKWTFPPASVSAIELDADEVNK